MEICPFGLLLWHGSSPVTHQRNCGGWVLAAVPLPVFTQLLWLLTCRQCPSGAAGPP